MAAKLALQDVWVDFPLKGKNQTLHAALKGISLHLTSGDRLGVYGPNGSGKTTLLRVLAGIYPPTRGSYSASGTIGSMLNLSAGIDPKVSGRDNIIYRSRLLGRSRNIALQTVEDAAEFGELREFIDQPFESYSSGMRMRLAFSIATAVPSEILIMDEWLSVGDERFQTKARERLERLVGQAEILVLASHNKNLLGDLCNQFISLDRGLATGKNGL
jgi:lipopolysaccharide transport system ATP-binding protein